MQLFFARFVFGLLAFLNAFLSLLLEVDEFLLCGAEILHELPPDLEEGLDALGLLFRAIAELLHHALRRHHHVSHRHVEFLHLWSRRLVEVGQHHNELVVNVIVFNLVRSDQVLHLLHVFLDALVCLLQSLHFHRARRLERICQLWQHLDGVWIFAVAELVDIHEQTARIVKRLYGRHLRQDLEIEAVDTSLARAAVHVIAKSHDDGQQQLQVLVVSDFVARFAHSLVLIEQRIANLMEILLKHPQFESLLQIIKIAQRKEKLFHHAIVLDATRAFLHNLLLSLRLLVHGGHHIEQLAQRIHAHHCLVHVMQHIAQLIVVQVEVLEPDEHRLRSLLGHKGDNLARFHFGSTLLLVLILRFALPHLEMQLKVFPIVLDLRFVQFLPH
mmetsp:Transcript_20889/g.33328  ORF Transcript_20889/g.33328 Transcript_20889/m.33328 type:complete len:386 (+) Transcript_20889:210-1367(+)